jgi:hypothetical protein
MKIVRDRLLVRIYNLSASALDKRRVDVNNLQSTYLQLLRQAPLADSVHARHGAGTVGVALKHSGRTLLQPVEKKETHRGPVLCQNQGTW